MVKPKKIKRRERLPSSIQQDESSCSTFPVLLHYVSSTHSYTSYKLQKPLDHLLTEQKSTKVEFPFEVVP